MSEEIYTSRVDANNTIKWNDMLPNILEPFINESLYGYLLRLDDINGYLPGTIIEMIGIREKGRLTYNYPSIFFVSSLFDFEKLSMLTGVLSKELNLLTIPLLIRYAFGANKVYTDFTCYSKIYKLCPLCIVEGKINILNNFYSINICLDHKLRLHTHCKCKKSLELFSYNVKPYHCPYCHMSFTHLERKQVFSRDPEYKRVRHLNTLFTRITEEYRNIESDNGAQQIAFIERILHPLRLH